MNGMNNRKNAEEHQWNMRFKPENHVKTGKKRAEGYYSALQ